MTGRNENESRRPNMHLKRQRLLRGWSQAYIAKQIGTNAFTVGRWERGESRPGPYFRAKLRALFGLEDEELGFVRN